MPFEMVFVYGSLKRGFYNHHFMKDARFISTGTSGVPFTTYTNGRYPNLVLENGQTTIHGELYEVDATSMPELDLLEDEYPRDRFPIIRSANNKTVEAWVYHNRDRTGVLITSGVFEG